MKITKEVEIPAKTIKATVKKIETTYCDFPECKNKVILRGSTYLGVKCRLCNRDVCYNHKNYDSYYSEDYPEYYCVICYDLWIPARTELINRQEIEYDQLMEQTKKESLEKNENNRNKTGNKNTQKYL